MKNPDRGIRVFAVNNYKVRSRFDIYLEFSGQREWLMSHRHNGYLFKLLERGISLGDLRRFGGRREQSRVQYLLRVIDEYLEEEKSA